MGGEGLAPIHDYFRCAGRGDGVSTTLLFADDSHSACFEGDLSLSYAFFPVHFLQDMGTLMMADHMKRAHGVYPDDVRYFMSENQGGVRRVSGTGGFGKVCRFDLPQGNTTKKTTSQSPPRP